MSFLAANGLAIATISVVAVTVAGIWMGLWAAPPLRWPRELFLSEPVGGAGSRGARGVVALVPARDEASLLPLTLPPLLAQRGLGLVVLVDDASSDGTARVARDLATAAAAARRGPQGARLEVVRIDGHAEGWSGKVAAQARGLARARELRGDTEWLLLVDADIRLREGALPALLEVAETDGRDLVSVMARLRAVSFWERLLVPPFVYFFHLLYPFRLVRRDGSKIAAAAGGCVLVRVAALERAGGLEAIRDRLIDDVALARAVKRSGGRVWLGFDPGVESVRAYETLAEVWRMIARNAFVQLGFRWTLLALTLVGLGLVFVSPPFGLAAAIVAGWAGGGADDGGAVSSAAVAAAGFAVAWLLQVAALWPSVRHHRAGFAFAWTLPLAAALYGAMTVSSAWSHLRGRTSRWRGREYRRSRR